MRDYPDKDFPDKYWHTGTEVNQKYEDTLTVKDAAATDRGNFFCTSSFTDPDITLPAGTASVVITSSWKKLYVMGKYISL